MQANYIDQVVAEQRLTEISQEASRIRRNNQKPEQRRRRSLQGPRPLQVFQPVVTVNLAPVIELNLMTEVAKLAA